MEINKSKGKGTVSATYKSDVVTKGEGTVSATYKSGICSQKEHNTFPFLTQNRMRSHVFVLLLGRPRPNFSQGFFLNIRIIKQRKSLLTGWKAWIILEIFNSRLNKFGKVCRWV